MAIDVIAVFMDEATVKFILHVKKNEEDSNAFVDPTGQQIAVYGPDGVQKSGYINVSSSSTFTAGWTVTGATSGATGFIISKPSGTSLELQQVTGVWESGETITSADGIGTSLTTSALLRADLCQQDSTKGHFEYLYHTGEGISAMALGAWHAKGTAFDGSGATMIHTPFDTSFEVGE